MKTILTGYLLFQIAAVFCLLVIGVLSWLFWDKRYGSGKRGQAVPNGFERTEEVNIDPTTGKRERVYYNPQTGERIYISE
jgi:hypothetical protein